MKNLIWCHDNSYLGIATVQDNFTLDYLIYIFRTETDEIIGVQNEPNLSSSKNSLEVFPNPSNGECKIEIINCNKKVSQCLRIKDLFGRIVYSSCPANCVTPIDFTQFQKGIYIAELLNGQDEISSQLFVVQQ
ncbi:MAG: T9SS type A sorting domain-containing protein [Chitinophagales bacterium]|nr:T9SS type A sorting domain-containing protein [Chitinophagales bacterium]